MAQGAALAAVIAGLLLTSCLESIASNDLRLLIHVKAGG
jgi:hypothetical protein